MTILSNPNKYKKWRDDKLSSAITDINQCVVEIKTPKKLTDAEIKQIKFLHKVNNFAIIKTGKYEDYSPEVLAINQQLGLIENDKHLFVGDDNLAKITQNPDKKSGEFIPYTDKKINWHTDGYYNPTAQKIRSFSLFCSYPAKVGGSNGFIDNEILYILLREKNEKLAELLTTPNAMTIPEHKINGVVRRPESVGAIFSIDELTNSLHLRYTQRKKNIAFTSAVIPAIKLLDEILDSDTKYHFSHTMSAGEGIICNNIIHKRSEFSDGEKQRLMLRGRYFVRV